MLIHSQNKKSVLLQGLLSGESNTLVFYAAHLESCSKIPRYEESRLDEHIIAKIFIIIIINIIIIIILYFQNQGSYTLF